MNQEKDNSIDKSAVYQQVVQLAEQYNAASGRPKVLFITPPEQEPIWEGAARFVFQAEKITTNDEVGFIEQQPEETETIWRTLSKLPEKKIALEIGLGRGGFHVLLRDLFASVISIESDPAQILRLLSRFALDEKSTFICGYSHDKATISQIKGMYHGLDFLFIDGGHEYKDVKADYENYAPLVKPGGIIAFHDVGNELFPGIGQFLEELSSGRFDGISRAIITYPQSPNLAIEVVSTSIDNSRDRTKPEPVKSDSSTIVIIRYLLKLLPWRLRESLRAGGNSFIKTYKVLGLIGRQAIEKKK